MTEARSPDAQLWFLTGSQGLYGEDTLQQVARAVAPASPRTLDDAAEVPVESSGSRC